MRVKGDLALRSLSKRERNCLRREAKDEESEESSVGEGVGTREVKVDLLQQALDSGEGAAHRATLKLKLKLRHAHHTP
eukprot:CAMPEP_0173443098 /NCGR_PEP_ID=MMETSP1357-20121228/28930_1 /TAXON_ID=77926 /ORGANISM="Hemiselmis rufescens, Strain PCC563" /LENGTH=77 /DNA_ID=CAMNT_0014408947 /DNA_START=39 /DNA_END=271 /DNA_ORIENTATION=-